MEQRFFKILLRVGKQKQVFQKSNRGVIPRDKSPCHAKKRNMAIQTFASAQRQ